MGAYTTITLLFYNDSNKKLENKTENEKKDIERYRWLRKQFAMGLETYIGEFITSEDSLDKYIDRKLQEKLKKYQ